MLQITEIENAYKIAEKQYGELEVDVSAALERFERVSISIHCWQGDDVGGFENEDGLTGGGIQATGNYPGKARNADELRSDLDKAFSLIPGTHRLNLHAIYAETGGKRVERDELQPEHYGKWVDWARQNGIGMDFNPSYFSHPKADDGFTLTSLDKDTRQFWIDHGRACRRIGEHFGRMLGKPCITNFWIPHGYKDTPADRKVHRELLKESLNEIFAAEIDTRHNLDSVESKLFGIGSESYVVGSHEFYLAYALTHKKVLCLDSGHYHPTERISDKISSVMGFLDKLLLHVVQGQPYSPPWGQAYSPPIFGWKRFAIYQFFNIMTRPFQWLCLRVFCAWNRP